MRFSPGLVLRVVLLLGSGATWAQPTGIERYEYGDYAAAVPLFQKELADPQLSPALRARTRIYLAASLYTQGLIEEARKPLELLAREDPEVRVDPARFPPELVEFAELIRKKVESERQLATREAELQAARETVRQRVALRVPAYLRPQVFGLFDGVDRQLTVGAGLAFERKPLEVSVRVLLGAPPVFQVQGGVVPGEGALRLFLGGRASLLPGINTYGGGPVAGGRLALPAGFVGMVDLGVDYFFVSRDDRLRLAVTAQAGVGFDLHLP
jgi:hypothetical protein